MIATVTEADLDELLPLMRGYCDFYEVAPSDEELLAMARKLIANPELEGVQLIARDDDGTAVGFATIFWTWQTLSASRLGVMNDLFVAAGARGGGHAEALIAECAERCRAHGARRPLARLLADGRAGRHHTRLVGQHDRLHAVAHAELHQHARHVLDLSVAGISKPDKFNLLGPPRSRSRGPRTTGHSRPSASATRSWRPTAPRGRRSRRRSRPSRK